MRRSILLLSAFLLLGGTEGITQSRSAKFEEFRGKAMKDFQKYRQRVLEHYADFLNGEWHDFEAIIEEESPYTEPKPKEIPVFEEAEVDTAAVTNAMMTRLPDVTESAMALEGVLTALPGRDVRFGSSSMPGLGSAGMGGGAFIPIAETEGKTNYELSAMRIPDPNFAFGPFPGQTRLPSPGEARLVNVLAGEASEAKQPQAATAASAAAAKKGKEFKFDFYGMEAAIPDIDFSIADAISTHEQTGEHWKKMDSQKGGKETARQLFGLAQQLGLNGYLTFRLAEAFANEKFKESNQPARMSATHYLMSQMGYDMRLTILKDGIFTVMMPFDQKVVYGLASKTMDGRKYSMLMPEGYKPAGKAFTFSTAALPADALGKTSDLRLTGLNLPMKPKEFEISRNGLTIKGTVNENIQRILHHYPQMPTGDFASSWIDQQLRDDIVAQLKTQMADMTEKQAINTLMSLCHYGFNYSTDQDFHGFEKPYFLEENFIYDKNDCEDRAIFFSYLVWNALGLPCQLVQYPGHESVTIAAVSDNIQGCYYDNNGVKYYSSDPTYRGSGIGMVMPTFKTTVPSVDKHYKK